MVYFSAVPFFGTKQCYMPNTLNG